MNRFLQWVVLTSLFLTLLVVSPALAQEPTVDSTVISSGGSSATVDNLTLNATIGQSLVGTTEAGVLNLTVGFGGIVAATEAGGSQPDIQQIYLPVIFKN